MRTWRPTTLPWGRPRHELALLVLVGAFAFVPVNPVGDQDLSRLCLSQAIVHGRLSNDACLTPSFDKAVYGGHLYSDKAPGMSLLQLPAAEALRLPPVETIPQAGARLWGVRVLSSGLALLVCAFLVGRVAEGVAPGRGAAALAAFGLGTIVSPLAATSFEHVAAGALAFGAFVLAWRRRPLAAGLAAGAAVLVEYQVAAIAAVVGVYAMLRGARSLAAYAAGLVPGLAALLAYDALAFGSPLHLSYRYVAVQQQAGGFFGIAAPRLHGAYEVLVGESGLLLVSPLLAAAAYGLWLLARAHLVEAVLCAAVACFFVVVDAGYYVPYGGTQLGPRFVAPALPFLAAGLGPAFARRPRVTALLTVLSVLPVVGLTLVWSQDRPLHQTIWGELARLPSQGRDSGLMRHMTPTWLGWTPAGSGWGFAVLVGAAVVALALALPGWSWSWRKAARGHPLVSAAAAVAMVALLAAAGYAATKPVVLRASVSGSAAAALPGDEVDFAVSVVNETGKYLPHAVLMIRLPRGADLLGRPAHERGRGCRGRSELACDLSFMEAHMQTTVHLGVRIAPDAPAALKLTAWGVAGDSVGPVASFTVQSGSGA